MELKLVNLSKSYGRKKVLENINLELDNGIFGLLGANGVGKTTLFNIISGYSNSDKGEIFYPEFNRSKEVLISVLPQSFSGYPEMTIIEFLEYIASIKGDWSKKDIRRDIDEKLETFNLRTKGKDKLKTLSGGQLRRVGLAQAFLLNPKIILLDEPSTGLDPKERINLKNYISKLRSHQIIFISTHIVSDLEDITDEIFILKNGNFVEEGEESKLVRKLDGKVWEFNTKDFYNNNFLNKEGIVVRQFQKNRVDKIRAICNEVLISNETLNMEKTLLEPTLEDLYLWHFQGGFDNEV